MMMLMIKGTLHYGSFRHDNCPSLLCRLDFISVTVDFLTSCAFQEMNLLHTLLLQCIFDKAKLASSK